MPQTISAIRQMRKSMKRREINRRNLSRLRTELRKLRAALSAGDCEQARQLLPHTVSVIDKSIQKGILHPNAAARYKSRLTSHLNKLLQEAGAHA